jgi:hypothetical protein
MPERRRGLRVPQSRAAKIFEPGAARYFAGHTHDISSTGVRLELPASMPLIAGRLLDIHIGSGRDGATDALAHRRHMAAARIVWVQRDAAPRGRALVGVEFLSRTALAMDAA